MPEVDGSHHNAGDVPPEGPPFSMNLEEDSQDKRLSPEQLALYSLAGEHGRKSDLLDVEDKFLKFTDMVARNGEHLKYGARYILKEAPTGKWLEQGSNTRQVMFKPGVARRFTFHKTNGNERITRAHCPNINRNLCGYWLFGDEDITYSVDSISSAWVFKPAGKNHLGEHQYTFCTMYGNAWEGGGAWWVDNSVKEVGLDKNWEWRVNGSVSFQVVFVETSN